MLKTRLCQSEQNSCFVNAGSSGVTLYELSLLLFLYIIADMVLLNEPQEDLKRSLDNLKTYCDKWGLHVNTEKIK